MGSITFSKYGQYVEPIIFRSPKNESVVLKIIGLNSALFCGYDNDDVKKLALGLDQVTYCDDLVNIKKEFTITCLHHPFDTFHPCEKPTLRVLERFSNIVLSGHLHEPDNTFSYGRNGNATVFVSAGASYDKRESDNAFDIIELDFVKNEGSIIFYKYLHQDHLWVKNKDINHLSDGIFNFKFQTNMVSASVSKQPKYNYKLILNYEFNTLNRTLLDDIVQEIKTITGDIDIKITKLDSGSVKMSFESTTYLSKDTLEHIDKIKGVDVVELLIEADSLPPNDQDINKSTLHWKTIVRPDYLEKIFDMGSGFTHPRIDNVSLKDLFVVPYFKKVMYDQDSKKRFDVVLNSDEIISKKIGVPLKIALFGADNSGKTTIAKWYYKKLYDIGCVPLFISGTKLNDIRIKKIKKIFQDEFDLQYFNTNNISIDDFDDDRIVIIIDDLHKTRLSNSKHKFNLITNIHKYFQNVIVIGNDLMQYETFTTKTDGVKNPFELFDNYHLLEFGPKLRYDLITKWNLLGNELFYPNEMIRLNNDTESHVNSIIGNNFVPSYPVYLIIILQARETLSANKPEYSLHGFYYELIINEALNKAVTDKKDISLYYNYITEYAFYLFDHKVRLESLPTADFIKYHNRYCADYQIDVDYQNILQILIKSKLLKSDGTTVSIAYKYVYYFFVAKYLANHVSTDEIKNKIKLLCERVYRDEFANIVMFLTHLTKDQFVLNQLITNSQLLFKEFKPVRLEEDVLFINDMVKRLPEQIYEPVDIAKIKEEELKDNEEQERQEKEFDLSKGVGDYDINEDISMIDVVSMLIKAIKTIEIIGQVTKKYWGELKAEQKYYLTEETYMLGFRTQGFIYSLLRSDTDMVVGHIKYLIKKAHHKKQLSKLEIEKASKDFIFGLSVMLSFGITKRIGNAIGYEKLSKTFESVLEKHSYNSVKLIDASIKLEYNKTFPWDNIKLLSKETEDHFLAHSVLQKLVIDYLYIYYTTVEEKQKICAALGIRIDQQRLIDMTSTIKK
jgi:hypothetical protein